MANLILIPLSLSLCLSSSAKDKDQADAQIFFYLYISCLIVSSCYTLVWDLKMDWGLFDRNAGENTFLREEIVYPHKVFVHTRRSLQVLEKSDRLVRRSLLESVRMCILCVDVLSLFSLSVSRLITTVP